MMLALVSNWSASLITTNDINISPQSCLSSPLKTTYSRLSPTGCSRRWWSSGPPATTPRRRWRATGSTLASPSTTSTAGTTARTSVWARTPWGRLRARSDCTVRDTVSSQYSNSHSHSLEIVSESTSVATTLTRATQEKSGTFHFYHLWHELQRECSRVRTCRHHSGVLPLQPRPSLHQRHGGRPQEEPGQERDAGQDRETGEVELGKQRRSLNINFPCKRKYLRNLSLHSSEGKQY